MLDRKLEPLVKKLMVKYLGELEDDDLVMFVLEHLKDHKSPQKLVEGLEPVRRPIHLALSTNTARSLSSSLALTFFPVLSPSMKKNCAMSFLTGP